MNNQDNMEANSINNEILPLQNRNFTFKESETLDVNSRAALIELT